MEANKFLSSRLYTVILSRIRILYSEVWDAVVVLFVARCWFDRRLIASLFVQGERRKDQVLRNVLVVHRVATDIYPMHLVEGTSPKLDNERMRWQVAKFPVFGHNLSASSFHLLPIWDHPLKYGTGRPPSTMNPVMRRSPRSLRILKIFSHGL